MSRLQPSRKRRRLLFAVLFAPVACGDPGSSGGPPTYRRDVAPLVFRHCADCHRPGEAAPFSLLTYAEVQKRAKQIEKIMDKMGKRWAKILKRQGK